MANSELSNLPEITNELKTTDELYVNESGTSKKIKGDKIVPTVLTQNITATIDLSSYKGDVTILSNPTANITLTFSNTLPSGRLLKIVNKSSLYKITFAGGHVGLLANSNILELVSDGTNLNKNNKRVNIHSISSADYTILDDDDFDIIEVTTVGANRTITLPTRADNIGRIIQIKKVDAGPSDIIIEGEGSETIEGSLFIRVVNQFESVTLYGNSTEWKIASESITNSVRRNYLINSNFDFWQRGFSFTNVGVASYVADRWKVSPGTNPIDVSLQSFTIGQTSVPNNPKNYIRVTPNSTATHFAIEQRIEGVRTLSDRIISGSFYVQSSGTSTVTVDVVQHFGTGSTDSNVTTAFLGTTVVGTSWNKVSFIGVVPSISGKNVTDVDDYISILITSGNLAGSQTFDIAQVQLNEGSVLLGYEPRSFQEELALCQRYYEKTYDVDVSPGTSTNIGAYTAESAFTNVYANLVTFAVVKRTIPTILFWDAVGNANKTSDNGFGTHNLALWDQTIYSERNVLAGFVGSTFISGGHLTADAEL
jgi:hypothetical protein